MAATRILLVDDEIHIVSILERRFKQAGYEVEVSRNGAEGFEAACQTPPDIVIADYQMPQMDGLEFAEALASEPATASIPVVMLTARGHLVDQERVDATNIKRMLAKPFSARDVFELIESVLGEKSTGQPVEDAA